MFCFMLCSLNLPLLQVSLYMHAPFTDGFHPPTCKGIWTKRQGRQLHRVYVCAQGARKISSAGPVLLVGASSILRAMEKESQSELWACSVAAVDCLQSILKPWTWIGVQPPQFLWGVQGCEYGRRRETEKTLPCFQWEMLSNFMAISRKLLHTSSQPQRPS